MPYIHRLCHYFIALRRHAKRVGIGGTGVGSRLGNGGRPTSIW